MSNDCIDDADPEEEVVRRECEAQKQRRRRGLFHQDPLDPDNPDDEEDEE